MNFSEAALIDMYRQMNLGKSKYCQLCHLENPELQKPVTAWFIGENFDHQKTKILFIGKNARGEPGTENDGIIQTFDFARDCLWLKKWAYWNYTRSICAEIFDSDTLENIAFTNLVKCNASPTIDTTTELMKQNCISNLKVVRNEISIIKPDLIIAYTGYGYDGYWNRIFDHVQVQCSKKCSVGLKMMPWMEAKVSLMDREMYLLRVGHPERLKKADFVQLVSSWIKGFAASAT